MLAGVQQVYHIANQCPVLLFDPLKRRFWHADLGGGRDPRGAVHCVWQFKRSERGFYIAGVYISIDCGWYIPAE